MTTPSKFAGMGHFLTIWSGQLISGIGSVVSGFALGVWVFQQTGSPTRFALITLFTTVPGLLLGPLTGSFIDRWSRKKVLIGSDGLSALGTVIVLCLVWPVHRLETWHIYAVAVLISLSTTVQQSAFGASVPLLVPREQLGRAAGLSQISAAASRVLAPFIAGALLVSLGLAGVLVLDLITAAIALAILSAVSIPQPPPQGAVTRQTLWADAKLGWTYIRERPGLLHLLLLFSTINLVTGMVQVLLAPMVLSFADARAYGLVLSAHGLGFFAGGLWMTTTGGPRRRIRSILGLLALLAVCLLAAGLEENLLLIAASFFAFMFIMPIISGCSQVIWQSKVPAEIMGRVFAVRRMIAFAATPVAYLAAGPLAEFVFEPAMAEGGSLALTFGQALGTGPGRGIAALFGLLGCSILLVTIVALRSQRLRHLEEELPSQLKTTEPAVTG